MLGSKRRSFSRKFSSSLTGEFFIDSATSDIETPHANVEVQKGSELAGTPDQNHQPFNPPPARQAAAAPPPPPAAVEPKRLAMTQKREDVLTAKHTERVLVVGKGVILTANVTSCDKVVVEGQFQGNIKTGTFVLSEGGQMEGEVRCSDGCIGGNMKATITATKTLLIGKAAIVTGDMVYDSLQVMDGGRLQGKLTHYSSVEEKPKPAAAPETAA